MIKKYEILAKTHKPYFPILLLLVCLPSSLYDFPFLSSLPELLQYFCTSFTDGNPDFKDRTIGKSQGSASPQFPVTSTRWRNMKEEPADQHRELHLQEHWVRVELSLLSALQLLPGPASRLLVSSPRRQPSQNSLSSSSPTLSFVQGNPEKTLTSMHRLLCHL